jgi:hypothetical protein
MHGKFIRMVVATAGLTGVLGAGAAAVAPAAHASESLVYTSKSPCGSGYHEVIVGTGPYGTLVYLCYK